MLHHKLSNHDFIRDPGRQYSQCDRLRTGKQRNGNVPVLGGLTAEFEVARFWSRNSSAGALGIQCDYASEVIAGIHRLPTDGFSGRRVSGAAASIGAGTTR